MNTDTQTKLTDKTTIKAGARPENDADYSEKFDAAKVWKAYNKGCDHRSYGFAGEHVGGTSHQWDKWSEDERKAYLRGYNGQFINSEVSKS